jgi:hypothetical protein
MAGIQIAAVSVCAPVLLRNTRTAACVALSALPFVQIGGIIAASDGAQILRGAAAVATWIMAVAAATVTARSALMRSTAHALASCVSIGGIVLFYLRAEFAGLPGARSFELFGPVASALTLGRRNSSPGELVRAWIALSLVAAIFFAIAVANRLFLIARARRA